MGLSLYCPVYGYYEKEADIIGKRGDFFTSVSVGNLFGQLLAFQFAEWLDEIKCLDPQLSTLNLVEAGAHNGQLAGDILTWLQEKRTGLFEKLNYVIVEPSPRRREWQSKKLAGFEKKVTWVSKLAELTAASESAKFHGIIFCNELLDAMPVHRLGWDAKNRKWFEWGVALEGEKLIWTKMASAELDLPSSFPHLPSSPTLLAVLPDNYIIEISPAAEDWWREAANVLGRGRLMTIDYGFTFEEIFSPSRTQGTLRGYFNHHVTSDILTNVGEQDLTAHVNYSALQIVGESVGLATEHFSTQTRFLTRILEKTLKDQTLDVWNTSRTRQFQTLTHPEHLGRALRLLVQSR